MYGSIDVITYKYVINYIKKKDLKTRAPTKRKNTFMLQYYYEAFEDTKRVVRSKSKKGR
jgi:hypothetical protein